MKIGQRGLAIGGGVLIAVAALGWFAFQRYAIQLPAIVMDWRDPIGPNQTVEWEPGPDVAEAPAGTRPPNIVLIAADRLALEQHHAQWRRRCRRHGADAPYRLHRESRPCSFTWLFRQRHLRALARGHDVGPLPDALRLRIHADAARHGAHHHAFCGGRQECAAPDRCCAIAEVTELDYTEMGMPQSEVSMAVICCRMRATAPIHIGKWHLGETNGPWPPTNQQGFDESLSDGVGWLYLNLRTIRASVEARNWISTRSTAFCGPICALPPA